jgi:hypothetical protein
MVRTHGTEEYLEFQYRHYIEGSRRWTGTGRHKGKVRHKVRNASTAAIGDPRKDYGEVDSSLVEIHPKRRSPKMDTCPSGTGILECIYSQMGIYGIAASRRVE